MTFYKCEHCGNIIAYIHDSGVRAQCCGEEMKPLLPNTTDAAGEKHVPVIKIDGQIVTVSVGAVEHPMLDAHYIEWIMLETKQARQRKTLKPGDKPVAVFALTEGDEVVDGPLGLLLRDPQIVRHAVLHAGGRVADADDPVVSRPVERLRHKETDRAAAIVDMLTQMGVPVQVDEDEMTIEGMGLPQRILTGNLLKGGQYTSHGDHRMVMALKVASLGADSPVEIDDTACVAKSFPGFLEMFETL